MFSNKNGLTVQRTTVIDAMSAKNCYSFEKWIAFSQAKVHLVINGHFIGYTQSNEQYASIFERLISFNNFFVLKMKWVSSGAPSALAGPTLPEYVEFFF